MRKKEKYEGYLLVRVGNTPEGYRPSGSSPYSYAHRTVTDRIRVSQKEAHYVTYAKRE